jgi:hypothetical protein
MKIVGADDTCKQNETALAWNSQGPQGPPGPPGPPADTSDLEARIAALEDLLACVSLDGDTIIVSGCNVQVVNGLGSTSSANGLGNVIIGYNEPRGSGKERSGSHMLVVGSENNYTRFGGIVVGRSNEAMGDWASIGGGYRNTASGDYSSVSGGHGNTASGQYSSVSGGEGGTAEGRISSVSGGRNSTASGEYSSVSGGDFNTASGPMSSVSGGESNEASAYVSSVSG